MKCVNNHSVLEIHQITEDMLDLNLSNYDIFTFDDCLYSQFYYYKHFEKFHKPMIFFFSANIFRHNEDATFKKCDIAHKDAFLNNDYSAYMSLDEIKFLSKKFTVAYHGYNHVFLENLTMFQQLICIRDEIKNMFRKFKELELDSDYFQPPYNYISFYDKFLNLTWFKNRTPIESLLINNKNVSIEVWVNDVSRNFHGRYKR